METIQIFQYNNNPVSFIMENGEVMINATAMARHFGKEVKKWLDNEAAHEFIDALAQHKGLSPIAKKRTSLNASVLSEAYPSLVKVVKGGTPGKMQQGTWLHDDVALEFARWLNPLFAIWCNDRIKELLRFGITATDEMLIKAATDPGFVLAMLNQIKENHEHCRQLENRNTALSRKLIEASPKVEFYDNLQNTAKTYDEKKTFLISKIAHELGMKASELNSFLHKKGVQTKIDGAWMLTTAYRDTGLTIDREMWGKKVNEDGDIVEGIVTYLAWTQKGRQFILSLFE